MDKTIIWLHDKALNTEYFKLEEIDENHKLIFIWDDEYFKERQYALKRLIFIYECLCELPLEILHGKTIETLQKLNPDKIIIPHTADTVIKAFIDDISKAFRVTVVKPPEFASIPKGHSFTRFFKYWNKAKKTAFLQNGETNV